MVGLQRWGVPEKIPMVVVCEDRLRYLREVKERREAINESITEIHPTSYEIATSIFRINWTDCSV
jgi:hypothetical protein